MPSFNPQAWQNYDLKNENQARDFLRQLSNWCIQMQQMSTIAGLLNGQGLLSNTASQYAIFNPGAVTTNQSVECSGVASVFAALAINTAVNLTITLNHVAPGVLVVVNFFNGAGTTQTFKLAYTNPAGTAGTPFGLSGGGSTNLTTTGLSLTAGQSFVLVGSSGSSQMFLAQT